MKWSIISVAYLCLWLSLRFIAFLFKFGSVVLEQVTIPWEWGFHAFFSLNFFAGIFFWATTFQIISETSGTKFTKTNTRSGFLSKNHPISKKKRVESESGCRRYCWFKISCFIRIFVTTELLQHEYEIWESPDKDFHHMGRWKMILLLLKTGYNKYSELYWRSYVHFNSGAAYGVGSIGDVPSHPTLVGTCFTFISFNIAAFDLGYLEMCPHTPGYVGTCYFISMVMGQPQKSLTSKSIC